MSSKNAERPPENPLVIIDTHPVQYRAPMYRYLSTELKIPLHVIFGSDYSTRQHLDQEFNAAFSWDQDLLGGYSSEFLRTVDDGGTDKYMEISAEGLGQRVRALQPSGILITGYSTPFYRSTWKQLFFGAPCPLIFRGETTDHAFQRSWSKQAARDLLLKTLYSRSRYLLYIGDHSLKHFKRLGCPESKLIRSPYSVDHSVFQHAHAPATEHKQTLRSELQLPQDKIILMFSGKLSKRKGPDLLLQSVGALSQNIQDQLSVLFVGDGALRAELEAFAQNLSRTPVHFAGFQNQEKLSAYYAASDIAVLPSIVSETWGLVVNEALHHGVPCIVSDQVGSAPDLITAGQTGEIVQGGSQESLSAAIEHSLKWIREPSVKQQCYDRIAQYTIAKSAEGIAEVYRRIQDN